MRTLIASCPRRLNGIAWVLACSLAILSTERVGAQSNGIVRQVFAPLPGGTVPDLTNRAVFPSNPVLVEVLSSFEAPTNGGSNYGQRLSGWITSPATGSYRFWIASDDNAELHLSTNEQPAGMRRIAWVPGQTLPREWEKYPEQQSAAISLEGGQRYYIEALMKQDAGMDHLSVRWRLPDENTEEPIPGARLQAYRNPAADSVTMRHGGKVRVRATANDAGYHDGTVQIATPPAWGWAVPQADGTILYSHTNGTPATDSFSYQLTGAGGPPSAPATVTIHFAGPGRFATDPLRFPSRLPLSNQWALVEAFPGLGFNSPNTMCSVQGDQKKLFLVESKGRVWLIPDVTAGAPAKILFLNITNRVNSNSAERGAVGVACHPDFASNGFIYVSYIGNVVPGNTNTPMHTRVSRFTRSPTNPLQADPNSELMLIDQLLEGPYHAINTCQFGPDGYLYVAIGDEGVSPTMQDGYHNGQIIDRDLYSCVLRIDVDKRPGNLEPNPHVAVPRDTNGLAHYSVPADNPFVGATSFNQRTVNPGQVRTEMFVVGLRNPWQFSFDPWTNKLWIADDGVDSIEKVVVLGPGENAGWSFIEGIFMEPSGQLGNWLWGGPRRWELINGAAFSNATITLPRFQYWHGRGTNQGGAIIGGFIYQGTNYPGLDQQYVFGDFVNGHVWSINPTNPYPTFRRLITGSAITAFLPDPSNNDILLIQWAPEGSGAGRIKRLVFRTEGEPLPATLSETGFFADLADLSPGPGVEHFEPNLRFWSDHADKTRWFHIQDATNKMTYSRDGAWTFPAGMVLAKHFDLSMERGNPATSRRVETRFLVKTTNSFYGASYKWNPSGTEAFLVPDGGDDFDLAVTNHGSVVTQHYHIPSRAECLVCHSPQAGGALSPSTRQLNREGTIAGDTGNQLTLLQAAGYLAGLNENPTNLPRFYRASETNISVEARARSYLAVNCAYCHQAGGPTPPSWDGRPEFTRAQTGLINGQPLSIGSPLNTRLILPGDLQHSVVWLRVARTNGITAMPPLGSSEVDTEAVNLLADWILNGLFAQTDYDIWRFNNFASLTSPEGDPAADPDHDNKSNFEEFLEYTDPRNRNDAFHPPMSFINGEVRITLPTMPGRRYSIFTSTNLNVPGPWEPWSPPGQSNILSTAPDGPQRFFKIRIEQE